MNWEPDLPMPNLGVDLYEPNEVHLLEFQKGKKKKYQKYVE